MSSTADILNNLKPENYFICELDINNSIDEEEDFIKEQPEIVPIKVEIIEPADNFNNVEDDPLADIIQTEKHQFQGLFDDDELLASPKSVPVNSTRRSQQNKRLRLQTQFKAGDGTVWNNAKPLASINSVDVNTPVFKYPTGKGPARIVSSPLEAWHLIFDEPILIAIVKSTNDEIRRRKSKSIQQRTTDLLEIKAWIGLNYLCGLFRNHANSGPLDELWTQELGNIVFRVTMSAKRFIFLSECIRFSDLKSMNRLESISHIWEKFVINCRSYYSPSSCGNIDDHIVRTNDLSCPCLYHLPEDSFKVGLRLVTLCDAKTLYMCNAILATDDVAKPREILHLVSDIKGTKRNITLTERYTTLQLAQKLQQHQISLTGAIKKDAKEIPKELLSAQAAEIFYNNETSIITSHLNATESTETFLMANGISDSLDSKKIFQLTHHSCRKFLQESNTYSTNAATHPIYENWTLDFFHTMLDYGAFNAWILLRLSERGDAQLTQRDFIRQLGLYLTQQQLKRRLHLQRISLIEKLQISELLGESTDRILRETVAAATRAADAGVIPNEKILVPEGVVLMPRYLEKRVRCRICKDNKVRTRCQQCTKPLCVKHLLLRCFQCTGVSEESEEKLQN